MVAERARSELGKPGQRGSTDRGLQELSIAPDASCGWSPQRTWWSARDHWPEPATGKHGKRRAEDALAASCSVVVDNSNVPTRSGPLIESPGARSAEVRAVYFDVPLSVCLARNGRVGRARVPVIGFLAAQNRLVPPTLDEGFDRVDVVTAGD
jgi:hypothetical protein